MRKVILAVILVVVLIAGGLGGAVMADTPPDDSPKGMWGTINDGISEILAKIGVLADYGWFTLAEALNDINTEVDNIEAKLDDPAIGLQRIVDNINVLASSLILMDGKLNDIEANMVKTETDSEFFAYMVESGTDAKDFDPIEYGGEIRHVSLTVLTYGVKEPQDLIGVRVHEGLQAYPILVIRTGEIKAYNVEFDATSWSIRIRDEYPGYGVPQSVEASCYWTETYPMP